MCGRGAGRPLLESRLVAAHADAAAAPRRPGGAFAALLIVSVALGASLGLVEVAVPAKATGWGDAALAGVLLGCFALGSVVGGLLAGRFAPSAAPLRRYLLAVTGIGLALLPPLAATGPAVLGALLVVAGLGYGPATVALFECLDGATGVGATGVGATEALTWVTTAEAAGAAVGAAVSGLLVSRVGASAPFPVAAVVLAAPAMAVLGIGRTADLLRP